MPPKSGNALAPEHPSIALVHDHFENNLRDLIKLAGQIEMPLLICTVPVNLADCPPFGSEGDSGEMSAIAQFQKAQGLADFAKARDLDTQKFRADSETNAIIRRITPEAALVDAEEIFSASARDGIPGDDLFLEHVHPTRAGNHLLAIAFAKALGAILPPLKEHSPDTQWIDEGSASKRLGWTPLAHLDLMTTLHSRLQNAPFNGQLNHSERMAEIKRSITDLQQQCASRENLISWVASVTTMTEQHPEDVLLLAQLADLQQAAGEAEEAVDTWQRIVEHHPHYSYLYHLGAAMNRARRWSDAEATLRKAIAARPDFPKAMNSLGITLAQRKKTKEALTMFQKAAELDPMDPEPVFNQALTLKAGKKSLPADTLKTIRDLLRQTIDIDPEGPKAAGAHYELGRSYLEKNDPAKALPHYQASAKLEPQNPAAHLNLGLLQEKLEDPAKAIEAYLKVLQIAPKNELAAERLEALSKAN